MGHLPEAYLTVNLGYRQGVVESLLASDKIHGYLPLTGFLYIGDIYD